MPSPDNSLRNLFISLFRDSSELIWFFRSGEHGETISANLSAPEAPLAKTASEAVSIIRHREPVRFDTFHRLTGAYPHRASEIKSVEDLWIRENKNVPQANSTHEHFGQFCIAVAVHPTGTIDVKAESTLVKSCILYAENIRLYSPTASLLLQISDAIKNMSRDQAVNVAIEYMQHTGNLPPHIGSEAIDQLRRVALRPTTLRWTKRQRSELPLSRALDTTIAGMLDAANQWISTPAFAELRLAEQHGILNFARDNIISEPVEHITDFVIKAAGGSTRLGASDRDRIHKENMLSELLQSVSRDSEYPLLDGEVRRLVRHSTSAGINEDFAIRRRSKPPGLGEAIFRHLPVPDAPMDELLDLRRELTSVVSRFRRGLLVASAEIESAQWDDSFYPEASHVYLRHIAPALEELDETLHSTPALRKLFFASVGTQAFGVAGVLSLVASRIIDLGPELAGAFGLSFITTALTEWLRDLKARKEKARTNDWLLIYEARNKLRASRTDER